MIPALQPDETRSGIDVLPEGIHYATLDEVEAVFGQGFYRQPLMKGLRLGIAALEKAGCRLVYIDGSFVTSKRRPRDFDAAWEMEGVDPFLLDPVLRDIVPPRASQKSKYGGEFLIAGAIADPKGTRYPEFFFTHREGGRKGIIAVRLGRESHDTQ